MIAANKSLSFRDNSAVRYFNEVEARTLSEMVRKRNIFARHSYENNFYIKKINELSNRTIIEVFRSGHHALVALQLPLSIARWPRYARMSALVTSLTANLSR